MPDACPDCGGPIDETHIDHPYQVEIPRKPIYRPFNVPIGQCRAGRRRIQGRHPEPNVHLSYLITGSTDGGDQYVGLDRFGRVVEQRWDKAGTSTDRFSYTYDRDSNRLTKTLPLQPNKSETYGYDNLNQLTSFSQGTSHTQSWTLDAQGNWATFTNDGTPQGRTHNRQNQVTAVGATNLMFDNNGNTLTDDTGHTFTYDAWNRLMSATSASGTVNFTYDAMNRRLTETASGTTTDLYYQGERIKIRKSLRRKD